MHSEKCSELSIRNTVDSGSADNAVLYPLYKVVFRIELTVSTECNRYSQILTLAETERNIPLSRRSCRSSV